MQVSESEQKLDGAKISHSSSLFCSMFWLNIAVFTAQCCGTDQIGFCMKDLCICIFTLFVLLMMIGLDGGWFDSMAQIKHPWGHWIWLQKSKLPLLRTEKLWPSMGPWSFPPWTLHFKHTGM